jgi:hypothetical protein
MRSHTFKDSPQKGFSIDYVGLVFPGGKIEAFGDDETRWQFYTKWNRNYYRLAACLFGSYWDKWWSEWNESQLSEVISCLRNALGSTSNDSAELGYEDTADERWLVFNTAQLQIRDEFDWGWKR